MRNLIRGFKIISPYGAFILCFFSAVSFVISLAAFNGLAALASLLMFIVTLSYFVGWLNEPKR